MRTALFAALSLLWHAVHAQTVEDLQRVLKERDSKIRELSDRLDRAERKPEAEDDELNRALERTLVQRGAMVLPSRTYEIEPQLAYAHWDQDRGPFRREWDAELGIRAGVGWDSQLVARMPYVHLATATDSATRLGDVSFALVKQVAREERGRPGLLAALGWVTHTGRDAFGGRVPTGSGFNVAQAALTVVKRADPLVYFGGLSYSSPRSREVGGSRVQPGDTVGLRGGAVLAATPHCSVNAGLNLGFVGASRVDGQRIADSDTVLGTFQVGFATALSRRVMLNVGGEFRVSGPVPNFRLVLGFPIRF